MRDFTRQPSTHARGNVAEELAASWLTEQGYRIVARNVRTRAGEIDIVARDGDTLCFLEVATADYGPAIAAVTPAKQRRLARAASAYLVHRASEGPCRFDVLGMDLENGTWHYTLIRDAFQG